MIFIITLLIYMHFSYVKTRLNTSIELLGYSKELHATLWNKYKSLKNQEHKKLYMTWPVTAHGARAPPIKLAAKDYGRKCISRTGQIFILKMVVLDC